MAITFAFSVKSLILLVLLCLSTLPAHSTDFAVNGDGNWAIPGPMDTEVYNQWASNNRFQVGDTISFKYKKDSVMVVSEDDYKKCKSTHPIFFSNDGQTEYKLDQPGLFYFISGVDGHCDRGQKMIIKVKGGTAPPPPESSKANPSASLAYALSSASLSLFVLAVGNVACLALGFC